MSIINTWDNNLVGFCCPGCKRIHMMNVDPAEGRPCWGYNGNPDKPTFTPSILARSGHYVDPDHCWCKFNEKRRAEGAEVSGFECGICHSFVTDGRIQFLNDCTHELKGQTVDLQEWVG